MSIRPFSRERGQGIVEFAVIFPLFLFFLYAIFDVGLAMNRRATLQHAVREGARDAALSDNSAAQLVVICSRTIGQSQDLLKPANVTVTFETYPTGSVHDFGPGDAVDVKAKYTYTPFALRSLPLPGWASQFTSWSINMDVTGSSRLEVPLIDQAQHTCS